MDQVPPDAATGPCAGFKVLEFGTMVSGPLAGQNLGDLGADVIKIETLLGDTARWTGPPERAGINGFFSQFNRNKRAMAVNMKDPQGIALVRKLALDADVIICNYRPGVADRLGFGYDSLCADNRKLVFISITGFGPDGPYADRPAYDLVTQGMSGTMPAQGNEGPPQMIRSVIADKCTAITAASAALAALLERERTNAERLCTTYPARCNDERGVPANPGGGNPHSQPVPYMELFRRASGGHAHRGQTLLEPV